MIAFCRQRRYDLLLTGFIMLCALVVFLAFFPWAKHISSAFKETMLRRQYAIQAPVWEKRTKEIKRNLDMLASQIQSLQGSSAASCGAEIMARIRELAAETNLEVKSIRSEGEKPGKGILQYGICVGLSGDYYSIGKWVSQCLKQYPSSSVEYIEITRDEFTHVPAQAKVQFWFFSPVEEPK